ncbi:hypothetical protein EMIHUDRAFT_200267 [Emiliania huxleyi CCMP1516]|uniref:Serine aminopeptidase S33 domain-containing protein n=2 Tax=Emiliania huxleyi TaxID=2903 RepID=A0A0D3KV97_EMIH1|nr:hypothetical protein EMIHUDRAFT_200267 [Emiliania huxleyi CCMP1516]EOD39682.1 hypothetical protein EMIHUDRAFT_200267 [Emiliania huxleyi CCMP1516]|eukprot:XP_005792111.1 hypothetical protein EMIHUDRAFT_200267 [Emiliania huxleyi CCMP1516]
MGAMAAKHVNQMAFCPPNPTYRKEDVNMWLDTDRGNRIPAFHIRRGFPLTVLVSHANAEDLGLVLQYWAYMSQQLQVDVFAYEYSGYGHATGSPCEANLYSDARAALKILVDGFGLKPERDIVVFGKSLGSTPSAAWSSAPDLYAVCRAHHPLPPGWITGGSHNDIEHRDAFLAILKEFLAHILAAGPTRVMPPSGISAVLKSVGSSVSSSAKALWSCTAPPRSQPAHDM